MHLWYHFKTMCKFKRKFNYVENTLKIFLSVILSLWILGFNVNKYAYASNSSEEKEAQIQQIVEQVNDIQNQINDLNNKAEESKNKLEEANKKLDDIQKDYEFAKSKFYEVAPQLAEGSKDSYATHFALEILKDVVGNEFLSWPLFSEAMLHVLTNRDENLIRQIYNLYKTQDDLYHDLQDQKENADKQYSEAKKNQEELENKITQMRESLNIANTELASIKTREEKYGKAVANYVYGHGKFAHPCPNSTISSTFGEQRDEGEKTYFHKGIDFSASTGTPIYAADKGTVIEATHTDDYNGGCGMWVVISHGDGLVTEYMHCSAVLVEVGQTIEKGDNIARVGNTGDSTGSHLHFQVMLNNEPVNGMDYLSD